MALVNAKLILLLDRKNGTFRVSEESSRIYSRDENIALEVRGFTLDEVTIDDEGKTPYEPYFRIVGRWAGEKLAEVKLEPDTEPTPLEDGTYRMTAKLSTNTSAMVCAIGPYSADTQMVFVAQVYSSTEANPIAVGDVEVWSFPRSRGSEPAELPSASEVLEGIRNDLDLHTNNKQNPHNVTAAQVGAYGKGEADGLFARIQALNNVAAAIADANAAISALQTAVQTANLAIQGNTLALLSKADANRVYRKEETYNRIEIDSLVSRESARHTLHGKTYQRPTAARGWYALLCEVIVALGGNIATEGIVPGTNPNAITLTAEDGTTRSLSIVKSDDTEYTSIVR